MCVCFLNSTQTVGLGKFENDSDRCLIILFYNSSSSFQCSLTVSSAQCEASCLPCSMFLRTGGAFWASSEENPSCVSSFQDLWVNTAGFHHSLCVYGCVFYACNHHSVSTSVMPYGYNMNSILLFNNIYKYDNMWNWMMQEFSIKAQNQETGDTKVTKLKRSLDMHTS